MPLIEQLVNNPAQAYGSLAVNAGATDTLLTVTGGTSAPYPQTGSGTKQFRILLDTEIMAVTAGQGTNSWTVIRGIDGTVATTHAAGVNIYPLLTAGAITNLAEQGFQYLRLSGVGLFGSTGRYCGTMTGTGVAPATGTYLTGDWGIDASGAAWYCTAGGTPGTWVSGPTQQTYTPTWTATIAAPSIGNGILTGRYQLSGKRCSLVIECQFNTTTTGGEGGYSFSLPPGMTGLAGIEQELACKAYTTGGTVAGIGIISFGSNLVVPWLPLNLSTVVLGNAQNTDSTGAVGTGIPQVASLLTWQANASGYHIIISGSFQVN